MLAPAPVGSVAIAPAATANIHLIRLQRYSGETVPQYPRGSDAQKKTAAPEGAAVSLSSRRLLLAERVRNVVERRVQFVADALHRTDGGNGNQRGDQTIFDRGRALLVL